MSAHSVRPQRTLRYVALIVAMYFLAHALAQCGALLLSDHGSTVHVLGSSPAAELHSGHAHTDEEPHLSHEMHEVAAMPRSDNVLRVSGPAAVTAVVTLVVMMLAATPRTPRAPPVPPAPARSGTTILRTLCIDRR